MTLPTSRQRSWIYPDQREHMKTHHLREAKEPHPTIEYLSEHNSAHDNWAQQAHDQVRSSIKDNHTKDMYRLNNAGPPRLNRNIVKTKFRTHKHPERLSGGVYTSKEGQQYAMNRLKERVTELDARKAAVFGQVVAPAKISGPPGRDPNILKIDNAFTNVYDSLQSGDYLNLVANARAAVGELLTYGAKLGSTKISELTQTSAELSESIMKMMDDGPQSNVLLMVDDQPQIEYGLSRSKISQLKSALTSLQRSDRILEELSRVANLNETERSLALNNFKQKTPSLVGYLSRQPDEPDSGSETGSDASSVSSSGSEGAGRRRRRGGAIEGALLEEVAEAWNTIRSENPNFTQKDALKLIKKYKDRGVTEDDWVTIRDRAYAIEEEKRNAARSLVQIKNSEDAGTGRRRHRHSHPLMGRGKPHNTEGSELLYELNVLGDDAQKKNDFWRGR